MPEVKCIGLHSVPQVKLISAAVVKQLGRKQLNYFAYSIKMKTRLCHCVTTINS